MSKLRAKFPHRLTWEWAKNRYHYCLPLSVRRYRFFRWATTPDFIPKWILAKLSIVTGKIFLFIQIPDRSAKACIMKRRKWVEMGGGKYVEEMGWGGGGTEKAAFLSLYNLYATDCLIYLLFPVCHKAALCLKNKQRTICMRLLKEAVSNALDIELYELRLSVCIFF